MKKVEVRIIELRSVRVLLDYELADLYRVELRTLLQAVRRNIDRFPTDFMFKLNTAEYAQLKRDQSFPMIGFNREKP